MRSSMVCEGRMARGGRAATFRATPTCAARRSDHPRDHSVSGFGNGASCRRPTQRLHPTRTAALLCSRSPPHRARFAPVNRRAVKRVRRFKPIE